jgi:sec-independent protein translocase protein TatA
VADIGAPELIIIAIVILVLFGSKKLPDAARSLGRSMRIFKSEVRGMEADSASAAVQAQPAAVSAAPAQPVTVQPVTTQPVTTQPVVTEPVAASAAAPAAPVNDTPVALAGVPAAASAASAAGTDRS